MKNLHVKNFLKRNKKNIFNIVFLVLVFGLTLYYVFHGEDGDLSTLMGKMNKADVRWLAAAAAAIIFFIYGESHIIHYLLHTLGMKTKRFTCFLYSCIGFFFSCITPSASGGQPAQILYMRKNNLPVPVTTVVLMIVTITYKMVLVAVGLWLVIFDQQFIGKYLMGVLWIFYLGIGLNVFCVTSMMILVFHQKLATWIVISLVKFMERIHLLKHKPERVDKFLNSMAVYAQTAKYLKGHAPVIVKVFIITIIQRFSFFFVTYFIYRSYGLSGSSMYVVVMLQAVISLSVDMLPLPGGMGISEALFNIVYLPVFGQAFLLPGLILSRSFSFYTELFVSAALTVFAHFYIGRFTREEASYAKGWEFK
ncbi:MAG: lysylphosphatidylglycerol synthase transmembrane domain-containing protein [Eubacteriales bacterium]|nr:lysylphosphatidylglycerol synthase transmembrane domain-containing protein [Eubacteriales bacterium]